MTCDDCDPGTGPFNTWVFDGNDDSADMGATTCLNGKECAITVDSIDSCDAQEVSVIDCATVTGNFEFSGSRVGIPNGVATDGVVRFNFFCNEEAVVSFEGLVYGPTAADDSFLVSVNGESKRSWYFKFAVGNGAAVFTEDTWRHVGLGQDSEADQGRYQWQVAAGNSELELYPREDGAYVSRMRIVGGSDVCKFTKQADGLVTEASIGLFEESGVNQYDLPYSIQSAPYQLAVHGLALVGAFAIAVKAFTAMRLKQDYATISEHEI